MNNILVFQTLKLLNENMIQCQQWLNEDMIQCQQWFQTPHCI